MQAAFDAQEWERSSGLQPGAVRNAAVVGGLFFDHGHLLRQAGGLPPSVETVLVEVPRWNFNRNRFHPLTNEPDALSDRVRRLALLEDRWAVDEVRDRVALLAEWAWPLHQRRAVDAWIGWLRAPWTALPLLPGPSRHWSPGSKRDPKVERLFRADRIALDHFHRPQLSHFAVRNLEGFLRSLRDEEVRVLLVQIPARRGYLETARQQPGGREFLAAVQAVVDEASRAAGVDLLECPLPESCGLGAGDFNDYGHMNREGARAFTAWLQRLGGVAGDGSH